MRIKFVLLLVLTSQLCSAQNTSLITIPGTKCSMIPPDGFVTAANFGGFQNAAIGASIMINELPVKYETLISSFTKEALLSKGMVLVSKQPSDFSQGKAMLINITQAANGISYIKQMLIFGKNNTTIIVNGIYPEGSKEIEPAMKKALLSTVYDANQSDDPLGAAIFTIDTKDTDFTFTKFVSGSLLYSVEGKIPTEKPVFIISPSFTAIPLANQKKYAEDRIKAFPGGENNVIKQMNDISIDNMKGYEIIADGKTKKGAHELIYQVIIYDQQGNYFLIVGQSAEEMDNNLTVFKKMARTFKRK
ncbi:MAG: hypothetical protein H7Y86_10945 [Rhizobacter sp.]|nr:hypothetical protein [Ferruginibacter sp.]